MAKKKAVSSVVQSQLDRISDSLARLSKEVKTAQSHEILDAVSGDLEHITEQLQEITMVVETRSRPTPPTPKAPATRPLPPAPVRATATVPPRETVNS